MSVVAGHPRWRTAGWAAYVPFSSPEDIFLSGGNARRAYSLAA